MCGIFCSVSTQHSSKPDRQTLENLKGRGPDSIKEHVIVLPRTPSEILAPGPLVLTFISTVLALRGDYIQVQPLIDEPTGSVLCWNGEAWKLDGRDVFGNDSVQVFDLLLTASKASKSHDEILKVLTSIAGPFAFTFFDARSSILYYGRDRLGRRSLMISRDPISPIIISSNSTNSTYASCQEIDAAAVHTLDLTGSLRQPYALPWAVHGPSINKKLSLEEIPNTPTPDAVNDLQLQLQEALRLRVTHIPSLYHRGSDLTEPNIAVLFSGGLDCTLVARLAHGLLPLGHSIDLLNVAFENPRALKAANLSAGSSPYEICPDRVTGRSSHAELTRSCPGRTWRFVAINVPYQESTEHRSRIIDLMHPHATEMDLSIAMALYFAARGKGTVATEAPYTTPARVLLSGLGADELFAGYTRHATAFTQNGYHGLIDELELDFTRIGSRNLGRDDRVMSCWGREVRYPYLDETFVAFVLNLPVWEKCGFRAGRMQPNNHDRSNNATQVEKLDPAKMILRMLAWKLNMPVVARETKRAIQFGAKTAKMEIITLKRGRRKGTDIVQ